MSGKSERLSRLPTRARPAARSRASSAALAGASPHVLIANGSVDAATACEQQLRRIGFRVSVARTGFEAIVKASCQVPDLIILLEGSLGDLEAAETSRLLTICPVTAHIPVICLSSHDRVPQDVLSDVCRHVAV